MASYVSAKKKEIFISICTVCKKKKEIISHIRNQSNELEAYCSLCFERATGKKASKR